MKKIRTDWANTQYGLVKFFRIMRLSLFLLLFLIAQGWAVESYSQKTVLNLNMSNVTVIDVLEEIENQTDFYFLFNYEQLKSDKKISIKLSNSKIDETLKQVLKDTNLDYTIKDRQIIIKKEQQTEANFSSVQQQKTVTGKVVDEDGLPLPGVTVVVKGTTTGTITDPDGNFQLTNIRTDNTLVFSFVGLLTQEILVGEKMSFNITMKSDAIGIEEVVAIGYGTEIKRNLTSSVASVNTDDLQAIPATSLSNAIAGRASGVLISTVGGRPGTSSSITVRGATVADGLQGSTAPLYVIDNVIATKELFDLLDVNEVESISILKDAAASAVYGARASNGVILVTTKSGKTSKPKMQFTTSVGSSSIIRQVKHTTAYEQALLVNQAVAFGNESFSDEIPSSLHGETLVPQNQLDYLRQNEFGNFEEQSKITPIEQRYALNISGGADAVTYFLAGSYIDQQGIVEKLNYSKYNVRGKVNVKLSDNLKLSLNTDLSSDDDYQYYWPFDDGSTNTPLIDSYRQSTRRGNWGPAYINGLPVANFNAFNVSNYFDNAAMGDRTRTTDVNNFIVNLDYKVPFIEGLSIGATYNKRAVTNYDKIFRTPAIAYEFAADPDNPFKLTDEVIGTRVRQFGGADGHSLSRSYNKDETYQFNARADYNRAFGDHAINASFIYEQFEFERENLFARRRNPISNDVKQLFATSPDDADIFSTGYAAESGRLSYIGTLGYSYKEKYFLNGTFRYDGSTEFREGKRYGFFPSVSAAWILSEEDFWNKDGFVNFIKLRASYGRTGNDDLDPDSDLPSFRYLQGFQQSTNVVFGDGNTANTVIRDRGFPATNFTWDRTNSYNIALDLEFLERRLSSTIELYKNDRTNLFGGRNSVLPVLVGASAPPENYGEITVKGLEVLLNYKDNIGDLKFDVGLNFAYSTNEVKRLDENEALRDYQIQTGRNTNRIFGYKVNGIIRTQAQLDQLLATGYKVFNQNPYLGMPLYVDVRGNTADDPEGNTPDGVVDGNDVTLLHKHGVAPINYGISLGLSYKSFSLDMFLQGLDGYKRYDPQSARFAFDVLTEASWKRWTDAFDPVTNPNGSMPRVVNYWAKNSHLLQNSELWLNDGGFLRLKNLNVAYNLPQSLINKIGVDNAKIFFNGANLFFLYSKIKDYDPELPGSGIPLNRTYSLGLQFTL